jgi:hypothetical protein
VDVKANGTSVCERVRYLAGVADRDENWSPGSRTRKYRANLVRQTEPSSTVPTSDGRDLQTLAVRIHRLAVDLDAVVDDVERRKAELRMPRILGFHELRDVQHWVSSPKREEFVGPLGVTEIKTYVDPQGSKRVGLTMNVSDLEAMMGAMQTQEAADGMEHDGVIPRDPGGTGRVRVGVTSATLARTVCVRSEPTRLIAAMPAITESVTQCPLMPGPNRISSVSRDATEDQPSREATSGRDERAAPDVPATT